MIRFFFSSALLCLSALPAFSLDLAVPAGAALVYSAPAQSDTYALPIGPYKDGTLPSTNYEGQVSVQVWQVNTEGLTSRALIDTLKAQIALQGYTMIYSCSTLDCGGFDFRFNTRVAPGPEMYVNLRDYRFTSATHPSGAVVGLLVSRLETRGFVQVIHVSPDSEDVLPEATPTTPPPAAALTEDLGVSTPLLQQLVGEGHVVLSDLEFETGKTALSKAEHASLRVLAEYLTDNPERRIVLVGHTDATGSLESNIAISRSRAAAVQDALIGTYGIPSMQIQAEGAGYLAPIASNSNDAGRTANRRVEAVLLPE